MTLSGRDTPPSVQDGAYGLEPDDVSNFERDSSGYDDDEDALSPEHAARLARDCFSSSTMWLNASRRREWANSLRAFQSVHPLGSKYLSRDYAYRSDLYRPKTRAMVRKGEAQTATAFFSNEDVVSIKPIDEDDPAQRASADFSSALCDYRLKKSIKWFLTVVGARQDCDVMGICVAKTYWKYEEAISHYEDDVDIDPDNGMVTPTQRPVHKRLHDQPHIDLISPENFRFDPASDWRDPVATSAYLIELIPMYMQDIEALIESGEWNEVSSSALRAAVNLDNDTTRRAREQNRVPSQSTDSGGRPRDFDIVWVCANIMRWKGQDWHFYSVGDTGKLLTDPVPLKEVYLHGMRPYVVGFVIPETHKSYPSSKTELVSNLQRAANDDWNLRFDNVKLTLNPRQILKQGSGIEINDARVMMPGKILITKDPETDIKWDRPPDVTQSAYAEQDRINLDFDELVGDFSNSSVQANQLQEQSASGMNLMSGIAAGMNEYELRVFAETFVEPVIRQLLQLEQAYETDPVVLALAGKNAKLVQKYGINEITDHLLEQELTLNINVGIGATNPQMKLKNFVSGMEILQKAFGETLIQGINFTEIVKELMGILGYQDGERFFVPGFNPAQVAAQAQQNAKAGKGSGAAPQNPQHEMQMQQQELQAKAAMEHEQNQTEMQKLQLTAQNDQSLAMLDFKKMVMQEQFENQRTQYSSEQNAQQQRDQQVMQHFANLRNKQMDHQHDLHKEALPKPVESAPNPSPADNNPIKQSPRP